jgi:hypothetical protein
MEHTWHVKQEGDLCTIRRDDEQVIQQCPRSRLRQQMNPHLVWDETFEDLCRQLDATGEGTVVAAQVGKLFQL